MTRLYDDNFSTTTTAGISNSDTTLPVASVTNLPAIGSGDTCVLTIQEGSTIEQVNATAVSSLDITITRNFDGKGASAFGSGAIVELRPTASMVEDKVIGPSSATNNAIPRFDSTTGKLIQDSDVTISDANEMVGAGIGINTQTDSYSIAASDAGKLIRMNKATANTATLPDPSTVDDGFTVAIMQEGAGTTTIATAAGSIVSKDSLVDLAAQYSLATAIKFSSTVWALFGDLA